jgi:aminopeptidase-like protein
VLISAHHCHPSLANDNLSGVCVAAFLAKLLLARPAQRFTYRILFAPGTIGAVAWLAANRGRLDRVRYGLVLNCLGDSGPFNYKRSRRGNAEIDRALAYILESGKLSHSIREFTPYGYDERQYCSPGFNLPVGCLSRAIHGEFPEYHTSADDLNFIRAESLAESLRLLCSVVDLLENNAVYVNQEPYGEPQLGKRGLYKQSRTSGIGDANMAKLWILNLSDGSHSLLDIGERSHLPFPLLLESAIELEEAGLIRSVSREPAHALRTAS